MFRAADSERSVSTEPFLAWECQKLDRGRVTVLTRIAAETECDPLLVEFETAYAHDERNTALGKTEVAEIDTASITAANDRLEELGCYE